MSQLSPNLWHPNFILSRSNPFLPLPHPAELSTTWSMLNGRFSNSHSNDHHLPLTGSGPNDTKTTINCYLDYLKLSNPTCLSNPSVRLKVSGIEDSVGLNNLTEDTKAVDRTDAKSLDEISPTLPCDSTSQHSSLPSQKNPRTVLETESMLSKKFATRETTGLLKTWLNQHRRNPYPTKSEKLMLALITRMNLTQISTWFANARRRLKKENQMTWAPKIKNYSPTDLGTTRRYHHADPDPRHHHHHHHHHHNRGYKIDTCAQTSNYSTKVENYVGLDSHQPEVLNLTNRPSSWNSVCLNDLVGPENPKDHVKTISYPSESEICPANRMNLQGISGCQDIRDDEPDCPKTERQAMANVRSPEMCISKIDSIKDEKMNASINPMTAPKIWSVVDVIETR